MERLKRGIAGFLAGLVLFLSVLGAGVVVVPPVQVHATGLEAVYFGIEYLMGSSGMLTGDRSDVDTFKDAFARFLTKAGRDLSEMIHFGADMTILLSKNVLAMWKEFLSSEDGKAVANTYVDARIPDYVAEYITEDMPYYFYRPSGYLTVFESIANVRWNPNGDGGKIFDVSGAVFSYFFDRSSGILMQTTDRTSESNQTWGTLLDSSFLSNFLGDNLVSTDTQKVGYGGKADEIDDQKDLTITPDLSNTLSDKVADAKASNPAITYDELSKMVRDEVQAQTQAAVDPVPTPDEEGDGTTLGILASILAILKVISSNVFNLSTDIVQKITLAFADWVKMLVEGFAAGDWAIGIKSLLNGMAKAIDDYMPGIATKLSDLATGIDNWQKAWAEKIASIGDAIGTFKDAVAKNLASLGDRIMSGFREWAESISDLVDTVASFAGSVANSISEVISQSIANAKAVAQSIADAVASVCDQLAALGELVTSIPATIVDFFTIDVPTLKTAALAIPAVWALKFKPLTDLVAPLQGMNISSNYEYPVIKMDVPPFIQQIYPHSYIVLLDFGEHATVFLTLRLFLRASVWLWFIYFIIRHHIDVRFHVG